MSYERILTMQDISCVGQCSMTVALPVLAACGVEACVLPTAILSTHTGGFWKPAVTHLDGALTSIWQHWKESGIRFSGMYTGYLGSVEAVKVAQTVAQELLEPGGKLIVDPAMADNGKLYAGFDRKYVAHMEALCDLADVILPNLTEAAILAGVPYQEHSDKDHALQLLERLPQKTVVLTGVNFREGETGVLLRDDGRVDAYAHPRIGGSCSGTGDLFAASFVGAWIQGKALLEAVKIAADFTCSAIEQTRKEPAHWYGVKFEPALPGLIHALGL